jgi:hypothetical protein
MGNESARQDLGYYCNGLDSTGIEVTTDPFPPFVFSHGFVRLYQANNQSWRYPPVITDPLAHIRRCHATAPNAQWRVHRGRSVIRNLSLRVHHVQRDKRDESSKSNAHEQLITVWTTAPERPSARMRRLAHLSRNGS